MEGAFFIVLFTIIRIGIPAGVLLIVGEGVRRLQKPAI